MYTTGRLTRVPLFVVCFSFHSRNSSEMSIPFVHCPTGHNCLVFSCSSRKLPPVSCVRPIPLASLHTFVTLRSVVVCHPKMPQPQRLSSRWPRHMSPSPPRWSHLAASSALGTGRYLWTGGANLRCLSWSSFLVVDPIVVDGILQRFHTSATIFRHSLSLFLVVVDSVLISFSTGVSSPALVSCQ